MIDQFKIAQLSDRAQKVLCDDFPVNDFYNTVLGPGLSHL